MGRKAKPVIRTSEYGVEFYRFEGWAGTLTTKEDGVIINTSRVTKFREDKGEAQADLRFFVNNARSFAASQRQ